MRIDDHGAGLEVDVDPLDFRGHGRSDRATGDDRIADDVSDATAVLEQLVGGPAAVIGHSLGGVTAAQPAQVRADLVTAMLPEDPPLYFGHEGTYESTPFATSFPLIRAAIDQWQADGTSAEDLAAALAATPSMSGQGTLGDENTADAVAAMGEGFVALDTAVYDPVFSGESRRDFDTTRPIEVPGVLLQPDRDRGAAFFDEHAVAIAETSPEVEVVRITGVGDLVHDSRTQRGRDLAEVRRFLDTYAPA